MMQNHKAGIFWGWTFKKLSYFTIIAPWFLVVDLTPRDIMSSEPRDIFI